MFSIPIAPAVLVLHTGHSLSLEEYLFRVLLYILAVACVGVVLYWGVRVVEMVHSERSRWVESFFWGL